jgi:Zn ribbon nucleic-acid-binding protein
MAKSTVTLDLLKCTECGKLSAFRENTADGNACIHCGGYTVPFDKCVVQITFSAKG